MITWPPQEIICLVLDKRYEQWLEIEKAANKLGLNVKPFISGNGERKDILYDNHITASESSYSRRESDYLFINQPLKKKNTDEGTTK